MSRFGRKAGLTLVEILIGVVLLGMIYLAVSALYVASQRFYFTADENVTISYELQYAVEHIYKNVMLGIGDETSPPGSRPLQVAAERIDITINNNDPVTISNYGTTSTYSYYKDGGELIFDDGSTTESITPKVTIDDVEFSLADNLLSISLTASYGGQTLTFYSACYPRLSSFN